MKDKIMIIGTKEGVGKTLVSICIGKLLEENNIKATSFKGLEMTDMVYSLEGGLKIGYKEKLKLDALEAEEGIFNNPIVIHSRNDKSKVYVNGQIYAKAEEFDYKNVQKDFEEFIYDSFEKIKDKGYVVIEGTGECLEYVDREEEFLNFKIAKNLDSDIILVSDFEDNNSFANIYGTLSLITKEDKKRIKGIIINNFNGDLDYLKRGLTRLEKRIKIPFLGTIPHINMDILNEEDYGNNYRFDKKKELIIGVVKLPSLSHVSDFYPFEGEKEVKMLLIENKSDFKKADFIIIPGSKNTIGDLEWLKKEGFDETIKEMKRMGKTIMGICGGFQMLGNEIEDLYSLENKGKKLQGLGLIDLKTTYTFVNKTTIAKGSICRIDNMLEPLSERRIYGYEVLSGDMDMGEDCKALMIDSMNNVIGLSNEEGDVFGTIMHGIFEEKLFKKTLLKILKEKHGVVTSNRTREIQSFKEYKVKRFNEFYNEFKGDIDVERLIKVLKGEAIQ